MSNVSHLDYTLRPYLLCNYKPPVKSPWKRTLKKVLIIKTSRKHFFHLLSTASHCPLMGYQALGKPLPIFCYKYIMMLIYLTGFRNIKGMQWFLKRNIEYIRLTLALEKHKSCDIQDVWVIYTIISLTKDWGFKSEDAKYNSKSLNYKHKCRNSCQICLWSLQKF